MKTIFLLLFLAFTTPIAFGQNTEEENLKKLVMAETDAYYKRDADAWEKTWSHSEKISRTYIINDKNTTISGWEKYGPQIVSFLKNNPISSFVDIKYDSFTVNTNGNMAWIEYQQIKTFPDSNPDSGKVVRSKEYRILVKENKEWKIQSMITYDATIFRPTDTEDVENIMNNAGYSLLSANKFDDAIQVFKLNVKFHPKSWNSYYRLGEAYAQAGNKKQAINNYKKSLKLQPENESVTKAIQTLKAK